MEEALPTNRELAALIVLGSLVAFVLVRLFTLRRQADRATRT
jgi:hypothetical protein